MGSRIGIKNGEGRIKISVIYCIRNIINNKLYIGSAIDYKRRFWEHERDLKLGKHHSNYLQKAWNKYGSTKFDFSILEIVINKNKLVETEQVWLDFLKPEYNILKVAYSHLGAKRSKESKKRMSLAHVKNIIYQYDLQMNLIAIHTEGITKLGKDLGVKTSNIKNCLCGYSKTAFGFIWIKIGKE
jgi:group I intron endonuclease